MAPRLDAHWDGVYATDVAGKSWHEVIPVASLEALEVAGVLATHSVIDIGGAASPLVDALLARGHEDVTVLDISDQGLAVSRQRLGAGAARVTWIATDLLSWEPPRRYDVWHDRAVGHFFTTAAARTAYRRVVESAVNSDGVAILGVFAPDGPTSCSGLPVLRHDEESVAELVGPRFRLEHSIRQVHRTPWGGDQPFLWTVWRNIG